MANPGNESSRVWGTTQSDRFPAALATDYVMVDEHAIEHSLTFAREYARLLNYVNPEGEADGDWSSFFDSDIMFLLAEICIAGDAPTEPIEPRESTDAERASVALEDIYVRLQRIDDWYRRAMATDLAHMDRHQSQLAPTLQALISKDLSPALSAIRGVRSWRHIWRDIAHRLRGSGHETHSWYLLADWNQSDDVAGREPDDVDGDLTLLLSMQNNVRVACRNLGALAHEFLRDNLSQQSNHPPHIALYVAFLQLLDVLRDDVNTYTERHLDYYYRSILGLSERPGTPDQTPVMLELAPAFSSYTVPAGTPLSAGKGSDGKDIIFLTDADIAVNRARVASLRTLYFSRDKNDTQSPKWVRQAWAAPQANLVDGFGKALKRKDLGWPAFGDFTNRPVDQTHDATIGFLITSPVLLLQEGERQVSIRFRLDSGNSAQLLAQLGERAGVAIDPAAPLDKVFAEAWQVYVSTAKGWLQIPAPQFIYNPAASAETAIEVRFTLGSGDPALVPNQQLPEVFDSPWPSFKLLLNPVAAVSQYSTYSQMILRQVDIDVTVAGIGNLALQGGLGAIAAGKPFAAFGAMPTVGGYMQAAHPELNKDGLQTVQISLEWLQLPDSLSAYYSGYGKLNFDAAQFTVNLAMPIDGAWRQAATLPLFADGFKASVLKCTPPAAGDGLPAVDATPGSVRIELASPPYAFGHADYPSLFADQALRNVATIVQSSKDAKLAQLNDTIKPPLTPMVKSISLGYTAADSLDMNSARPAGEIAKFRHIHPFGCCPPQTTQQTVLPKDDGYDGHLFIGIADLDIDAGSTIVLHFQFCEQAAAEFRMEQDSLSKQQAEPAISWRYLSNNAWLPFDKQAVVSYTNEFQNSGIVRIDMPPDITDDNTLMPGGMVWIEVCASGDHLRDTLLVDILPHAVTATRAGAPIEQPFLPAGGIVGFQKKTAAIKSVAQPYASGGGSALESTAQYRTRVSERLKHKQRASQPGDYERLALAEFPMLWQAKCVTANNSRDYRGAARVAPGEVVLVVVPELRLDGRAPPLSKQILADIAACLQQLASPFVQAITVRNPVYRSVQVTVDVQFRNDGENGDYVQRLNAAISDCIAPWLRDGSFAEALGGGTLYMEELKRCIGGQPYVKAIMSKELRVTYSDGTEEPTDALNFEAGAASPDTPWTVFVPYAKHLINANVKPAQPQPTPQGIAAMTIGRNFRVGKVPAGLLTRSAQSARADKRYLLTIPRP